MVNISGGRDMTLEDMTTACEVIYDVVDPEANIIVGAVVDESLEGEIHVTVIATGFEGGNTYRPERTISTFSGLRGLIPCQLAPAAQCAAMDMMSVLLPMPPGPVMMKDVPLPSHRRS